MGRGLDAGGQVRVWGWLCVLSKHGLVLGQREGGTQKALEGALSAMSAGVRRVGEWLPHKTDGYSQVSEEMVAGAEVTTGITSAV